MKTLIFLMSLVSASCGSNILVLCPLFDEYAENILKNASMALAESGDSITMMTLHKMDIDEKKYPIRQIPICEQCPRWPAGELFHLDQPKHLQSQRFATDRKVLKEFFNQIRYNNLLQNVEAVMVPFKVATMIAPLYFKWQPKVIVMAFEVSEVPYTEKEYSEAISLEDYEPLALLRDYIQFSSLHPSAR